MSVSVHSESLPGSGAPWWRFRMVWLVIGGPLAVIVAGFVTLAIALSHPDPVVADNARSVSATEAPADLRSMDVQTTAKPRDPSLMPALQARNHAATGGR